MLKKIKALFFINFALISFGVNAQTRLSDSTKVDSLTFVRTRDIINKLSNDLFEKHTYTKDEKSLPYRLLKPKNYDSSKNYPVIIAFHNSSRIGNDNEKQLEHLSKIWIREDVYDTYSAFVIVPQFKERSSTYLKADDGSLRSVPFNDIQVVLNLLDDFQKRYNVDKSRIYLTGYSMGGSTAQNILNLAPDKFAAIVSVAAVPDFSNIHSLKQKSVFLIHGKMDAVNPYAGSEELFTRLKGNKNVVFKTFTELNHDNITIPLLLDNEIPNWLFKQKK
ncbi:carboxylesterase family protein [Sphingobacterium griseoflavum]|uniref:Phospholipase n=1 Tax=Sphingobacterium griseoflavum TaxID=1474952 RepID=A0ABQ3HXP5_9SPHI|nr:prolyl oligopeptidase family serine peptidase [Sphingobacterium griseoflavum]GHE29789.1 phospholipase [Sphingobacterium griseoflavum]